MNNTPSTDQTGAISLRTGAKLGGSASAQLPLLDCPFCGNAPTVRRNEQFGYTDVFCPNLLCSVTRMSRADNDGHIAIQAWNNRSIITNDEKEILKRNVDHYVENECVMSRASLNIIEKILNAI